MRRLRCITSMVSPSASGAPLTAADALFAALREHSALRDRAVGGVDQCHAPSRSRRDAAALPERLLARGIAIRPATARFGRRRRVRAVHQRDDPAPPDSGDDRDFCRSARSRVTGRAAASPLGRYVCRIGRGASSLARPGAIGKAATIGRTTSRIIKRFDTEIFQTIGRTKLDEPFEAIADDTVRFYYDYVSYLERRRRYPSAVIIDSQSMHTSEIGGERGYAAEKL